MRTYSTSTSVREDLNHLEEMAQHFDSSIDFDAAMAYYDVKEIAARLFQSRILEMGSSGGTVTRYLLPLATRLDIIEGTTTGIERTKKHLGRKGRHIRYFLGRWEHFTPDCNYTDIVFVRGLEHVEDPIALLHRVKRWLTPHGRLHIIVPNAISLHRHILVAQGVIPDLYALRDRDYQVGHCRVYDQKQLQEHVVKAGLKIVHSSGFFVKPLGTHEMGTITMDPNHAFVKACYCAGQIFPELATQLYVIGSNNLPRDVTKSRRSPR
jgi:2-polyprenyl-3-methyl-5-hydroxy-6-metoxy-1,4-benzoquinol methylase